MNKLYTWLNERDLLSEWNRLVRAYGSDEAVLAEGINNEHEIINAYNIITHMEGL